ncbi:fasciclin domain-containing protein [uncultured Winogradskyella sp.]|uniref:fasciclin domain-containing protein n=1 Tax=uncultured Winogradskyella sp. TaxID=395353 RepID=UPI002623C331|nr:fasciclin domain-containing protein [uncultured Winogradskyella sp.]
MKIISKTFKLLTVFLLVLGVTGCSDDDDNNGGGVQSTTVVDVALANGLTSLAAALQATDLVTTLQGTGPFTVFAPDNAAFDDLLMATGLDLDNLTADQETLVRNILLNHVIIGNSIPAQALIDGGSGYESTASPGPVTNTTLSLYYNVVAGTVEINGGSDVTGGADVTTPDLTATNGTVHIIDAVIALPTIATFATTNGALSTLVDALAFADTGTPTVQPSYIDVVSDGDAGPFTVFAPTNTAFGDVLTELSLSGFGEGAGELNAATTDAVLLMHIVNANVQSSGLPNGAVMTLGGEITADNTAFTLTDGLDREIGIITTLVDIQATNGVVHVVDTVIRPGN